MIPQQYIMAGLVILIPFAFGFMVFRFKRIVDKKSDMYIVKSVGVIITLSFVFGIALLIMALSFG